VSPVASETTKIVSMGVILAGKRYLIL